MYLHSVDDPIIKFTFPKECFQSNPNVALATTNGGGHIGSQEDLNSSPNIWHIKPAKAFLKALVEYSSSRHNIQVSDSCSLQYTNLRVEEED